MVGMSAFPKVTPKAPPGQTSAFPKVTPKVTKRADWDCFGLLAIAIKKTSKHTGLQERFGQARYSLLQPVAVNHRTENPRVGGSIPPLGTSIYNKFEASASPTHPR